MWFPISTSHSRATIYIYFNLTKLIHLRKQKLLRIEIAVALGLRRFTFKVNELKCSRTILLHLRWSEYERIYVSVDANAKNAISRSLDLYYIKTFQLEQHDDGVIPFVS